jgi:hypothetical protein
MKNSNDTIGNRSCDPPVCSAVPQPLCHHVLHYSFTKTYEALEKVKAFFYANSVTDADHQHILSLEKSFSIEAKFCQEAKDNVQLFC